VPPPEPAIHLQRYMDAFNSGEYEALTQFYHDDVVLVIGNGVELKGKAAIVDFYRNTTAKTRRVITIIDAFGQSDRICAELESEFLALEDFPDFTSGPMHKGDRYYINTFVIYELRDALFLRIRAAPFRREWRRY
jgi:hypothetical protein